MVTMIKYTLWLCLLYTVYCTILFLLQRQVMYPRGLVGVPSAPTGLSAQGIASVWLDTGFEKVEAWFLPSDLPSGEPAPAVMFAHGNGELIDYWAQEFETLRQMGASVLLVEYPGYGRSGGTPSQASITRAFLAAYDWLAVHQDVDPTRIVLLGRSLGGGAVCTLLGRRRSAALILMSTFTSARSFALRYLAPGFLVRDAYDNLAAIKGYDQPVLIVHGRHDEVVPYRHGLALHRAAPHSRLITYDSGHNDCPPDWPRFWQDIKTYLMQAGILP